MAAFPPGAAYRALAAHLADKAAGRGGISLEELDAALDRIDAESLS
jgi:hypothetical protein